MLMQRQSVGGWQGPVTLMQTQDLTKGDSITDRKVPVTYKLPAHVLEELRTRAGEMGVTATSYLIVALNEKFVRDDVTAGRTA